MISQKPAVFTRAILTADLEPISFEDLPLGGEWTTRRRTISESEIALFAGVAGDLSPLTIDAGHGGGGGRMAPPALLVAVAIGLGTVDMPLPAIAEWEWVNWKFPRPVRAGETIYARWTLTQKRPPKPGASTAVVVWRVDVHNSDGALCAEGEVGAAVLRGRAAAATVAVPDAAATPASRRRGRGRRTPAAPAAVPEPVAPAAPTPVATEKPASSSRRRRRRRSKSGHNGLAGGAISEPAPAAPVAVAPVPAANATAPEGTLSRVIRRLRRPTPRS